MDAALLGVHDAGDFAVYSDAVPGIIPHIRNGVLMESTKPVRYIVPDCDSCFIRSSTLAAGVNFLGVFNFNAPYLPWVLFGFSLILGNDGSWPPALPCLVHRSSRSRGRRSWDCGWAYLLLFGRCISRNGSFEVRHLLPCSSRTRQASSAERGFSRPLAGCTSRLFLSPVIASLLTLTRSGVLMRSVPPSFEVGRLPQGWWTRRSTSKPPRRRNRTPVTAMPQKRPTLGLMRPLRPREMSSWISKPSWNSDKNIALQSNHRIIIPY